MTKYFLLLVWTISIISEASYAQDQRVVDSLVRVLKTKTGAERYPLLYDLTFEYIETETKTALKFIEQAEEAAFLSGDSLRIVKCKRVKGQILYLLERVDEAAKEFQYALPIAVRNQFSVEQFYIENTLGKVHLFLARYDRALNRFFKSLELAIETNDTFALASASQNIGIAYYKLKEYQKALQYYQRSLTVFRFPSRDVSVILANVALCYVQLQDFQNAGLSIEKAVVHCGADCAKQDQINIEYTFGLIARGKGQLEKAESHFLRSYEYAVSCGNTRFQFDNIFVLSQLYMEKHQFEKAEYLLQEAEKLISDHSSFNLEVIKIYSAFSQLYRKLQNHRKASHYQFMYIQLKDSIYSEDVINRLMKAEATFAERENLDKLSAQAEVIALKEEIINRQQVASRITMLLAVVFIGFVIVLLRNYKQKRNFSLLLERKIAERTLELQYSHDQLVRSFQELDLLLERTSNGIRDTMRAIDGLCSLGISETSESVAKSYMRRIKVATFQLSKYSRLHLERRLID